MRAVWNRGNRGNRTMAGRGVCCWLVAMQRMQIGRRWGRHQYSYRGVLGGVLMKWSAGERCQIIRRGEGQDAAASCGTDRYFPQYRICSFDITAHARASQTENVLFFPLNYGIVSFEDEILLSLRKNIEKSGAI